MGAHKTNPTAIRSGGKKILEQNGLSEEDIEAEGIVFEEVSE